MCFLCVGGWIPGEVCIDWRNGSVGSASTYVHGNLAGMPGAKSTVFFCAFIKINLGRFLENEDY